MLIISGIEDSGSLHFFGACHFTPNYVSTSYSWTLSAITLYFPFLSEVSNEASVTYNESVFNKRND